MAKAKLNPLTKTQAQVLAFIKAHSKRYGWPPTRVEINQRFGWVSPNAAQSHLRAIRRKGYVQLGNGHRKITIV